MGPELVDINTAAKRLDRSVCSIRNLHRAGLLAATRGPYNKLLFDPRTLDALRAVLRNSKGKAR